MNKTISPSEIALWPLRRTADALGVHEDTIIRSDPPRVVLKRDKNGKATIVRYDPEAVRQHLAGT